MNHFFCTDIILIYHQVQKFKTLGSESNYINEATTNMLTTSNCEFFNVVLGHLICFLHSATLQMAYQIFLS